MSNGSYVRDRTKVSIGGPRPGELNNTNDISFEHVVVQTSSSVRPTPIRPITRRPEQRIFDLTAEQRTYKGAFTNYEFNTRRTSSVRDKWSQESPLRLGRLFGLDDSFQVRDVIAGPATRRRSGETLRGVHDGVPQTVGYTKWAVVRCGPFYSLGINNLLCCAGIRRRSSVLRLSSRFKRRGRRWQWFTGRCPSCCSRCAVPFITDSTGKSRYCQKAFSHFDVRSSKNLTVRPLKRKSRFSDSIRKYSRSLPCSFEYAGISRTRPTLLRACPSSLYIALAYSHVEVYLCLLFLFGPIAGFFMLAIALASVGCDDSGLGDVVPLTGVVLLDGKTAPDVFR